MADPGIFIDGTHIKLSVNKKKHQKGQGTKATNSADSTTTNYVSSVSLIETFLRGISLLSYILPYKARPTTTSNR